MTITVRTLRNAVDAGFRKLSGAPLKLRRAKLLAELSRAVKRGLTYHRKSCDQRFYTPTQRVGDEDGALGPESAAVVEAFAAVTQVEVEDLDYYAIGTNEGGFHKPHGDGGRGGCVGSVAGGASGVSQLLPSSQPLPHLTPPLLLLVPCADTTSAR